MHTNRIKVLTSLLCLLLTSCKTLDQHVTSVSSSTTDTAVDSIEWNMEDIKILNNINEVSIYKVSADLAEPAIKKDYPSGYSTWNSNVDMLFTRGSIADLTISREIYAATANSQQFIDIDSLPEEFIRYADGYDLYTQAELETYQQNRDAETLLQEWGISIDSLEYPISHVTVRQQVDGIPTMPLRGFVINPAGGKLSYGEYVQTGGVWTFSQSPVDMFDGKKYAVTYLIIPELKLEESVADHLAVIPFERLTDDIKPRILGSIITGNNYKRTDEPVKDITVTAAEVCYLMIYDNYNEYEKSTELYLCPYWVVYYKCGLKSGLVQQNAAFFPAVEGIPYE